jgi:CRP-like cAMP-binding protein
MPDAPLTPEQVTHAVKTCYLFTACRPEDQARIAAMAQPRTHRRGEVIFAQGAPGDAFFLMVEGLVRIERLTADGQEVTLHLVRPGEVFGLVPFFLDAPLPAHAICVTTRAASLRFPRTPFLRLLHETPDLTLRLLGGLSLRLHHFTQRFEDLVGQTLPVRLARYLLLELPMESEAEEGGAMRLPMSKRNLAAHLGTTPETLSRALRRLIDDRAIAMEGKAVRVLNPGKLMHAAGI